MAVNKGQPSEVLFSVKALQYSDEGLEQLIQQAAALGQPNSPEATSAAALSSTSFGPGLEHVSVREWGVEKEDGVNADEEGGNSVADMRLR